MEFKLEKNVVVAKLDDGSDLFRSIETIMDELDQESAILVSGIGMLKNITIGFYNRNTGEYEWEKLNDPKELLSVKGSITKDGDMHLHVQVSGKDHRVIGGHLNEAEVFNVTELTMIVFEEMELSRERDENLDMDLLSVR